MATVLKVADRSVHEKCELTAGFSSVKIVSSLDKIYLARLMVTTAKLGVFRR